MPSWLDSNEGSGTSIKSVSFSTLENDSDIQSYADIPYAGVHISDIRLDQQKNHYIFSKLPGESLQFEKLNEYGTSQWKQ
ncbi:MAG: hypothetical protein IPO92_14800, partial [Saprospiraceae bacterium]|nr:hypothetical protein [Saprospiraceae bacterium]